MGTKKKLAKASNRPSRKTFKQSSKLSHAQSYPSLLQAKAYKYLLWKAMNSLRQGSIHYIEVQELRRVLNTHDGQQLKDSVEALASIKINWETVGRSDIKWGWSSLLAGCRLLTDNRFEYSFDPILVAELYRPEQFRIYDLDAMLGFESHYALKIYELALQYYDGSKGWGRTPGMDRRKLRELFNVDEHKYPNNSDFLKKAIASPLKEVNERAEVDVSFHDDQGKPRVRQYWFEARRREQQQFNFAEEFEAAVSSEVPRHDVAFGRFMEASAESKKSVEAEFFRRHPDRRGAYRRGGRNAYFEAFLVAEYPALVGQAAPRPPLGLGLGLRGQTS